MTPIVKRCRTTVNFLFSPKLWLEHQSVLGIFCVAGNHSNIMHRATPPIIFYHCYNHRVRLRVSVGGKVLYFFATSSPLTLFWGIMCDTHTHTHIRKFNLCNFACQWCMKQNYGLVSLQLWSICSLLWFERARGIFILKLFSLMW